MKAMILGATGLVGHALWRDWKERGWDVHGTYLQRAIPGMEPLDVLDAAKVQERLYALRPAVVVLTASNPFVDYCEMHPKETRRLNVEATLKVAEAAKRAAAKFVFFSTDYVFDGEKKTPYIEKDPSHAVNEYGRQKVAAEGGIQAALKNHLIARISGVFGWELKPKNFVVQLIEKCRTGKVKAASDLRYNPTYAPDIAAALAELVERDAQGVFHIAGSELLSKYEFARRAAAVFGLDPERVEHAKMAELSPVRRPAFSSLDCSKLVESVQTPPLSAGRALEKMREAAPEWEAYARGLPAS